MAHPLTQHPPNLLPFGAGSGRSPLSFGFGQPGGGNIQPFGGNANLGGTSRAVGGFGSPGAFGTPTPAGAGVGLENNGPTTMASPSSIGLGFGPGLVPSPGHDGFGSTVKKSMFGTPRPVLSPVTTAKNIYTTNHTLNTNTTTTSLKRLRRTSSSPSSSPSPLPSSSPVSPKHLHTPISSSGSGQMRSDDLSGVGKMNLGNDMHSPHSRRIESGKIKRARTEDRASIDPSRPTSSSTTVGSGMDVGVLLAALPSTSHLSILMQLIQNKPEIATSVMTILPQPDLGDCLKEINQSASKVAKSAVSWDSMDGQAGARRWNRVESHVSAWCSMSSTYIRFFTSPPNGQLPSDSRTIFTLLQHLTHQVFLFLSLIPTSTLDPTLSKPPSSAQPLLDLANLILSTWNAWLGSLSEEINGRGEMYPHSTVAGWAEGLDQMTKPNSSSDRFTNQTRTTQDMNGSNSFSSSSSPSWSRNDTPLINNGSSITGQADPSHPLVSSFRSAVEPIRQRFDAELGWLVGRGMKAPVF